MFCCNRSYLLNINQSGDFCDLQRTHEILDAGLSRTMNCDKVASHNHIISD